MKFKVGDHIIVNSKSYGYCGVEGTFDGYNGEDNSCGWIKCYDPTKGFVDVRISLFIEKFDLNNKSINFKTVKVYLGIENEKT